MVHTAHRGAVANLYTGSDPLKSGSWISQWAHDDHDFNPPFYPALFTSLILIQAGIQPIYAKYLATDSYGLFSRLPNGNLQQWFEKKYSLREGWNDILLWPGSSGWHWPNIKKNWKKHIIFTSLNLIEVGDGKR